jgi:hypothetical protein
MNMKNMIVVSLLAFAFTMGGGCTIAANRSLQMKNAAAIKAVPMNGGGAGIGLDLFRLDAIQSPSDAAVQLGAAGVDALAVWGLYEFYRSQQSDPAPDQPQVPNIQTGNNSPVQINFGGNPSQNNPNTTTATSTTQ